MSQENEIDQLKQRVTQLESEKAKLITALGDLQMRSAKMVSHAIEETNWFHGYFILSSVFEKERLACRMKRLKERLKLFHNEKPV